MKNFFLILVACCSLITFSADNSFSAHTNPTKKELTRTFVQKGVLSNSEVVQLFSDNTVDVLSEKTDRKTGKHIQYQAYVSKTGDYKIVFKSGVKQTRQWAVKNDGALCITRVIGTERSGLCGYIIPEGNGTYKMYKARHKYIKNGQIVGARQIKVLATFSNFEKGNTLQDI